MISPYLAECPAVADLASARRLRKPKSDFTVCDSTPNLDDDDHNGRAYLLR